MNKKEVGLVGNVRVSAGALPLEEEASKISDEFIDGMVFIRGLFGEIHEDITEMLEGYCVSRGLDFDIYLEKVRQRQIANDGRPIKMPFSAEAEAEIVKYIEECRKVFPFSNLLE